MSSCVLDDRGFILVQGPDARGFLQGLVTCQMENVGPSQPAFAALLSPQGKILTDFFVIERPEGGFLLDVPGDQLAFLLNRLALYKLRAKVELSDQSAQWAVLALWGEKVDLQGAFADPRAPAFGWRWIGPRAEVLARGGDEADVAAYEARRIAFALPKGGVDFAYGDAFPHEANMDRLHGLDFQKGCYVGQEVVSRVQHRGLARRRIVRVHFPDGAPQAGIEILAGDVEIGAMGSSVGPLGLALLRLDRVTEAMEQGIILRAKDGRELSVEPIGLK